MTPSAGSLVALRVNNGIALAEFRRGSPVRTYTLPRFPTVDPAARTLLLADWVGWSGVWNADELAVEFVTRVDPDDAELLAVLARATRPGVPVRYVTPADWKRQAGGPLVSKADVHANANARWPGLRVPDADAAVALWIGQARLAGAAFAPDGGALPGDP